MEKNTKLKKMYNQDIIEFLQKRYGFTVDYIRKALRGDRVGILPNKIIEEYTALESATREIIITYYK